MDVKHEYVHRSNQCLSLVGHMLYNNALSRDVFGGSTSENFIECYNSIGPERDNSETYAIWTNRIVAFSEIL